MDREPTLQEATNILLEDIRGKFDLIAEGLVSVRESLSREIAELRRENREEHEDFKRILKSFSQTFSNHENRIVKLEKTVYHR